MVRAICAGMVTYRGTAKTNSHKDRYMLSPVCKVEAKRGSKALAAQAVEAFTRLLRNTLPHEGATAFLDVTDRFGRTVLVTYTGKPTERNTYSSAVLAGRWFLEDDTLGAAKGLAFPEMVDV